jgi:hypothetical protein
LLSHQVTIHVDTVFLHQAFRGELQDEHDRELHELAGVLMGPLSGALPYGVVTLHGAVPLDVSPVFPSLVEAGEELPQRFAPPLRPTCPGRLTEGMPLHTVLEGKFIA